MTGSFSHEDEMYMRRALALAERGRGRVEPNPVVGCVLVRGRRIVGEGYHRRYGGPHAEAWALRSAGAEARGATAYVTLEPCCHHGKTPPCTEALIAAGVVRVVVAMRDPFPPVHGRGLRQLQSVGIKVASGLLGAEAARINGPYIKLKSTGRPWIILKWAQSLDGAIATRTGDSKWISSEASRAWVHRLRGRMDAIVVGVETAITDDPLLTCRVGRPKRAAARVVLDPSLRLPLSTRLVGGAKRAPTLVITDRRAVDSARAERLRRAGVEVLGTRRTKSGLALSEMLDEFGRRGMSNVMVEGGGRTLGAFFDAGLVDEAVVFVAPRLIGGQEAVRPLDGVGPAKMSGAPVPALIERRRIGPDELYRLVFTDPARL